MTTKKISIDAVVHALNGIAWGFQKHDIRNKRRWKMVMLVEKLYQIN